MVRLTLITTLLVLVSTLLALPVVPPSGEYSIYLQMLLGLKVIRSDSRHLELQTFASIIEGGLGEQLLKRASRSRRLTIKVPGSVRMTTTPEGRALIGSMLKNPKSRSAVVQYGKAEARRAASAFARPKKSGAGGFSNSVMEKARAGASKLGTVGRAFTDAYSRGGAVE